MSGNNAIARLSASLLGSLLLATVLLAAGSGTAGAGAGAASIGAPQTLSLTGTVQLTSIACLDADTCYVLGNRTDTNQGVLATLTDGGVTNQQALPQSQPIAWLDLACSPDGTCFAIGGTTGLPQRALVLPITGGVPGAAQTIAGDIYVHAGTGLACGPSGACYVVGADGTSGSGVIVPILHDRVGVPVPVPGTQFLYDVDCATADTCYAVADCSGTAPACSTSQGIVAIVDGQPSGVQGVQAPSGASPNLTAIACPNADDCYATGALASGGPRGTLVGAVVASVDGQPGALQTVAGSTWLYALACPSGNTCYALGTGSGVSASGGTPGVVVPITNGVAGAAETVDVGASGATTPLLSGDCPSSNTCYALSWEGIVPIAVSGG